LEDKVIWRYLDLSKFISMVKDNSLFLNRSDCVEDPFEGSVNRATYLNQIKLFNEALSDKKIKKIYLGIKKEWVLMGEDPKCGDIPGIVSDYSNWIKKFTYINCWHKNEHESEAMWRLYTKNIAESIVVKSTVHQLISSIPDNMDVAEIKYIDYESDYVMEDYMTSPFRTKRNSFSHEKEIRVIYQDPPLKKYDEKFRKFDRSYVQEEFGKPIKLKNGVTGLINEVRLSPFAPEWFKSIIFDILEKYDINLKVRNSEILLNPYEVKS